MFGRPIAPMTVPRRQLLAALLCRLRCGGDGRLVPEQGVDEYPLLCWAQRREGVSPRMGARRQPLGDGGTALRADVDDAPAAVGVVLAPHQDPFAAQVAHDQ